MNHNILLVEDSKEIYRMVSQAIAGPLIQLEWVPTISDAKSLLNQRNFDLILLDIELPDGNGIEFCTHILLKNPDRPVFLLTSHTNLSEKVLGFSAGADDYITKPFAPLELKARIEAKLRKIEMLKKTLELLCWKEIKINKSAQEVHIFHQNQFRPIELTALEFKLLLYLAQRPGEVVHRDIILNEIWGENFHVYPRSVDTHISKLRKKLGPVSFIIESIHGSGYKFNPSET